MITKMLKFGYKLYLFLYLFFSIAKLVFRNIDIFTKREWFKKYGLEEKVK